MNYLKICHWNANGVYHHKHELTHFLDHHHIDVMLISETHLTDKYNFKVHGYTFYDTKHPDKKGHGGTGILVKLKIRHHVLQNHCSLSLQATSVCIELIDGSLVCSSAYCPPNQKLTAEELSKFLSSLGHKFIAAGDFNAKHPYWGSRLTTSRGRQLIKVIWDSGYDISSCGQPTYWPTDRRKVPDLIDFAITKNINRNKISSSAVQDLSSDHSPVIVEYLSVVKFDKVTVNLTNKQTNWIKYKKYISSHLIIQTSLNNESEINLALKNFNNLLIEAAKVATPAFTVKNSPKKILSSSELDYAVTEKRRLRRYWQQTRSPTAKQLLDQAEKKLKKLVKDSTKLKINNYISSLSPTDDTNYSLWKATKSLKKPQHHEPPIRLNNGDWARSDSEKAEAFANYLQDVFCPHNTNSSSKLPKVNKNNYSDVQPIKVKKRLIQYIINQKIDCKKAPGYDKITGRMIKELPGVAVAHITRIFNGIFKFSYFPIEWKTSIITMIPKPGKDNTKVNSYRPISLLPVLSKLFEKVLNHKLLPKLKKDKVIPAHQFGFQAEHSTIEQVHRIAAFIRESYEKKEYCAAIFLDVAQAFDKVWHDGLIYKIQTKLPPEVHLLLESYLTSRKFKVKYKSCTTDEREIKAGVPQGSVLGPMLYLLFTSDLPVKPLVLTSTFADDTAILSSHKDAAIASENIQEHLYEVENWLNKWKLKVNENKSVHVTFSLRKGQCPPITLNDITIPQVNEVKYLGVHLDKRLTWKKHIETKKIQMKLKFANMYWLIGRNSLLDLEHKLLLYNSIIKPIWSYGSQLWKAASSSNIDIIQRFQSKVLRNITKAPWYVKNHHIHKDLNVRTVREEMDKCRRNYVQRLNHHPNAFARNLMFISTDSRLKKPMLTV